MSVARREVLFNFLHVAPHTRDWHPHHSMGIEYGSTQRLPEEQEPLPREPRRLEGSELCVESSSRPGTASARCRACSVTELTASSTRVGEIGVSVARDRPGDRAERGLASSAAGRSHVDSPVAE